MEVLLRNISYDFFLYILKILTQPFNLFSESPLYALLIRKVCTQNFVLVLDNKFLVSIFFLNQKMVYKGLKSMANRHIINNKLDKKNESDTCSTLIEDL